MKNEFVPYDIALAMKELGFNEECIAAYVNTTNSDSNIGLIGCGTRWFNSVDMLSNLKDKDMILCSAPLYQQAFRWFREEYGIFANIHTIHYGWNQQVLHTYSLRRIISKKEDTFLVYRTDTYMSCEEAQDACLRKLIEIVKTNQDEHNRK